MNILRDCRTIGKNLANTNGILTRQVRSSSCQHSRSFVSLLSSPVNSCQPTNQHTIQLFATADDIADDIIDGTRAGIGFKLLSLGHNVRSIKPHDPLITAHPNIHHNLPELNACCKWLTNGYGMSVPSQWDRVAGCVFDDVPAIEAAVVEALKESGLAEP